METAVVTIFLIASIVGLDGKAHNTKVRQESIQQCSETAGKMLHEADPAKIDAIIAGCLVEIDFKKPKA